MKTKTIKQVVLFKASPEALYDLLMSSKKHAGFTKHKAKMSSSIGGSFSAYNGYITGKNMTLEPGKKIVQSWRGSDWPKGHYSRVTFKFMKVASGTKLIFSQSDVPIEQYQAVKDGWKESYWDKLKKYLTAKSKK
jgi:activator of HSP90 ATPase